MKHISIVLISALVGACNGSRIPEQVQGSVQQIVERADTTDCAECDLKKYNYLRSEFQLLGAWDITEASSNTTYQLEIYGKGGQFACVKKSNGLFIEELTRDGDALLINGSPYGEFYYIDANNELHLYDKDPNYSPPKFIAVQQ